MLPHNAALLIEVFRAFLRVSDMVAREQGIPQMTSALVIRVEPSPHVGVWFFTCRQHSVTGRSGDWDEPLPPLRDIVGCVVASLRQHALSIGTYYGLPTGTVLQWMDALDGEEALALLDLELLAA